MKLLLIDARGLQADATGPYGNRWVETFTFNALAAQGVVFDRHLSVHPDPERARAVWRTGRHQFAAAAAIEPDLLALLRDRGVQSHLLIDASRPVPAAFVAGWGRVHEHPDVASTLDAARALLAGLPAEASWLVWLELGALLPPWDVPPEIVDAYFAHLPPEEVEAGEDEEDEPADEETPVEEGDEEGDLLEEEEHHEPLLEPLAGPIDAADDELFLRVQKGYASAVSHLDVLLGHLLDGMPDDVLVVLTGDHGQALGEHGVIGLQTPSLHAEVVRVPLIFAGAGCRPGRHVGALTASVDLAPTVAELAGGSLSGAHGRSLVPLLRGQEGGGWPYVGLGAGAGGRAVWGLWTPGRALHVPLDGEAAARLYVKPDDRCEVNDVRQHETERAEAMERTLRAFVEACGRPGPLLAPALEGGA